MARRLLRLLILSLLILVSCTQDNGKSNYPDSAVESITLLIDSKFTKSEKEMIATATQSWQYSSSNKLKFILIWDQPIPGKFYEVEYPVQNQGIFVWKLKKNDPNHFTIPLQEKFKKFRGMFLSGTEGAAHILIFVDEDDYSFYDVVLHEIGHLLGLKHLASKKAVMHSSTDSKCITVEDAQALCDQLGCIPRSNCGIDIY